MDKGIDKILKEFVLKANEFISSDEIYLFGSYAKGTQKPDSDIDIAIIMNNFTGDYLDNSAQLFSIVSKIDYRIEPVLLIKSYDKPGFIDHIKSYGKRLYPIED
ncbi:MAG: nucleotidyltransferase [Ignavibacteria bacterium]|nr:nucleotidyltransferase [Ignavibacteria bacterium]